MMSESSFRVIVLSSLPYSFFELDIEHDVMLKLIAKIPNKLNLFGLYLYFLALFNN